MTKAEGLSQFQSNKSLIKNQMDLLVLGLMERQRDALASKYPGADVDAAIERVRSDIEAFHQYGKNDVDLTFYNPDGSIDTVNQGLLDHLNLIRHEMRSSATVIADRTYNVDDPEVYDELRQAIKDMKTMGFTYEETVKMFNQDIKFSKSPTPHPTENLSINGIKAYMKVMEAAETSREVRQEKMEAAISAMLLSNDVSPSEKFNILDEIDLSDLYAENHNQGVNNLERFIEDTIEDEYGERPKISLDATLKSWDYDSDGKNNAEGFAFMAKTSSTTMAALNMTIRSIEEAQQDGLVPIDNVDEVEKALENCKALKGALEPVYARSREITLELAKLEPDARQDYYKRVYENEYTSLERQFASIYDAVGTKNRGLDFYQDTISTLRDAVEGQAAVTPREENPLDDALRIFRRNGVALEKGQPRQNDFKHIGIIHNLINYKEFRDLGVLSPEALAEIDAVKGYATPEEKGGLSEHRKHEILNDIAEYVELNGNARDIQKMLYDANPLEFDDNGYPAQTRSLLDRFNLRHYYPHKYEDSINSDAQPGSDERLHFFFRVFGIKRGSSMSLHEDRGTLPRKPDLTVTFVNHSGRDRITRLQSYHETAELPWHLDKSGGKDMHKSMTGPSDAQKIGGPAAQMEIFWIWGQGVQNAWKHKYYLEQMFGTGMASDRFGADGGTNSDVAAQEMMEIVKEHGPFDRSIQEHRRFMRAALAESFTQQGRHKRYAMSTPAQITDDLTARMTDKIHKRFELEGLVPVGTYIAPKPKFRNDRVEGYMRDLSSAWIDRFNKAREATVSDGVMYGDPDYVFNDFADKVTCPNIMGYSNHGARPAAKGGSAKQAMNVRAIENQQRHQISQLFAGSLYGAGKMMKEIGYSYRLENPDPNQVKLTDADIEDFMSHEYWNFNIHVKAIAAAGSVNNGYALDQIGWPDATFDELKAVGERVLFVDHPERGDEVLMVYSGPRQELTNAQLYAAKLWHDRLAYVSHMEAALTKKGEGPTLADDPETIMQAFRPENNSPEVGVGVKTQLRWHDAMEIAGEHMVNLPQFNAQYAREAQWKKDQQSGLPKAEILERQGGEDGLRQSRSAFRAGTLAHVSYWSGEKRIGIQPKPDERIERLMTPKAWADATIEPAEEAGLKRSLGNEHRL